MSQLQLQNHIPLSPPQPALKRERQTNITTLHPKSCIHTSMLTLPAGALYHCTCAHHPLLNHRSSISLRVTDGSAYISNPDEPEIALWCYCSDGPGHKNFEVPVHKPSPQEREKLDEIQWRAEKKALQKQRECPGFRRRMNWVLGSRGKQGGDDGGVKGDGSGAGL